MAEVARDMVAGVVVHSAAVLLVASVLVVEVLAAVVGHSDPVLVELASDSLVPSSSAVDHPSSFAVHSDSPSACAAFEAGSDFGY